ncbi:MAG: EAL domain-containing protein [Ruminococcaceae bacterium]|nr:EAL domain-containing protein [Oscillospiraceae bacterium]
MNGGVKVSENAVILLHEFLSKVKDADDICILQLLINEYSGKISDETALQVLNDIKNISEELIILRSKRKDENAKKFSSFTAKQQDEFAEAERILDNNLLNYHFQPIVSAVNGSIYSYEALMRPDSTICPSPYHIMKYAELTGRLDDIEKATFINILEIIDSNTSAFNGRRVFINSIPTAKIPNESWEKVRLLLAKHSGTVVVEMTEQSELEDSELERIECIYKDLDVKIAIDDYGTGYSNVQNLLRFMPHYVKIDRSLLSEIQNNQKKRHFVKEIVDFCHDNEIKALAEGVETGEELRTVILLGVDLIQGYYTGRPAAEIIDSIPSEIRKEIERYRREREEGKELRIYKAEKSERVSLDRLAIEGYQRVVIGKNGDGEVTVAGTPGKKSDIHLDISDGFKGSVILENAELSNANNRPCIDIGENCEVTLETNGINNLRKGGIRVPESSKLIVKGNGRLAINIDGSAFYAIGNDMDSRHGELVFEQGVDIKNNSASGVCIGSGLGGKINLIRGQFALNMTGYLGVGIGAFNSDCTARIFACDITMDISSQFGVAIGSMEGNCDLSVQHSAIKAFMSGSDVVGIGTLSGSSCDVSVCESSVIFDISADNSSAVAALRGDTNFEVIRASMHITSKGDNSLGVGGTVGKTKLQMINSDSSVNLVTRLNYIDYINKEDVKIEGGRARFNVNGEAKSFENT